MLFDFSEIVLMASDRNKSSSAGSSGESRSSIDEKMNDFFSNFYKQEGSKTDIYTNTSVQQHVEHFLSNIPIQEDYFHLLMKGEQYVNSGSFPEDTLASVNGAEGRVLNLAGLECVADLTYLKTIGEIPSSYLNPVSKSTGYVTITPNLDDKSKLIEFLTCTETGSYVSASLFRKYENVVNLQYTLSKKSQSPTGSTGVVQKVWENYSVIEHDITLDTYANLCTENKLTGTAIPAIKCKEIPSNLLDDWILRARQLYCEEFVEDVLSLGFHLVPRSSIILDAEVTWRISFSAFEKKICSTWNSSQRQCFYSLASILRTYLNIPMVVTNHKLKTLMFWAIERKPCWIWENVLQAGVGILEDFVHALANHELPNYFIPKQNLLAGLPTSLLNSAASLMSKIKENARLFSEGLQGHYSLMNQFVFPKLQISFAPDTKEKEISKIDNALAGVLVTAANIALIDSGHQSEDKLVSYRKEIVCHAFCYLGFLLLASHLDSSSETVENFIHRVRQGSVWKPSENLTEHILSTYVDLLALVTNFCNYLQSNEHCSEIDESQLFSKDINMLSKGMLTLNDQCLLKWKEIVDQCNKMLPRFFTMNLSEIANAEKYFMSRKIWKVPDQSETIEKKSEENLFDWILEKNVKSTKKNGRAVDTVSGSNIQGLEQVIFGQFKHLRGSSTSWKHDLETDIARRPCEIGFVTGGHAEGTGPLYIRFVKRPGQKKLGDVDFMIPMTELDTKRQKKYIRNIPSRPGFVHIDITNADAKDRVWLKECTISKDGRKYVSATYARSYVINESKKIGSEFIVDEQVNTVTRAAARYSMDAMSGYESLLRSSVTSEMQEEVSLYIKTFIEQNLLTRRTIFEDIQNTQIDIIPTMFCELWPPCASKWLTRALKFLDVSLVYKVICTGFQLVPKCSPGGDEDIDWRISFSIAEAMLIRSMTIKQWRCFCVGKIILHEYLDIPNEVISTYHFKTIMLWACEQKDETFWVKCSLSQCLLGVFDDLVHALVFGNLPHYFIDGLNLFCFQKELALTEGLKSLSHVRQHIEFISKSIETDKLEVLQRSENDLTDLILPCFMYKINTDFHVGTLENINAGITNACILSAIHILVKYACGKVSKTEVETAEILINALQIVSQTYLEVLADHLRSELAKESGIKRSCPEAVDDVEQNRKYHQIAQKLSTIYRQMTEKGMTLGTRFCSTFACLGNYNPSNQQSLLVSLTRKLAGDLFPQWYSSQSSPLKWIKLCDIIQTDNLLLNTPLIQVPDSNDIVETLVSVLNSDNNILGKWFVESDSTITKYITELATKPAGIVLLSFFSKLFPENGKRLKDTYGTFPHLDNLPTLFKDFVSKRINPSAKQQFFTFFELGDAQRLLDVFDEFADYVLHFIIFFLKEVLDTKSRRQFLISSILQAMSQL